MRLLPSLLIPFSWVHLAHGEFGDLVSGTNLTGALEVNLFFPRNETYALLQYTPVVFAFRNAGPEFYIDPKLKVDLCSSKQNRSLSIADTWLPVKQNLDEIDPFFSYWGFEELDTEDHWVLAWSVGWSSCSLDSPIDGKPGLSTQEFSSVVAGRVEFTTKNATKPLDLVAALQEDSCSGPATRAFLNVTDYTNTSSIGLLNGAPCAIVANATVTEAPCCSWRNEAGTGHAPLDTIT